MIYVLLVLSAMVFFILGYISGFGRGVDAGINFTLDSIRVVKNRDKDER